MRLRSRHQRVHDCFKSEIDDIIGKRRQLGIDKKDKGSSRITLAITRHSLWGSMKNDIIKSDLPEDKIRRVGLRKK